VRDKAVVVLVSDLIRSKTWLYEAGIPQQLYSRLSQVDKVRWHHREPSVRYPHIVHRHYVPIGLKQEIFELAYSPLRKMRASVNSNWKKKFLQPGEQVISYDDSIQHLLLIAKETDSDYVALVGDVQVAVFPESVALSLELARITNVDVFYCSQVEGLIPTVISTDFLARWLQQDRHPNPILLRTPASLSDIARVTDIKLVSEEEFAGTFRCSPLDAREKRLLNYWEERSSQLQDALRQSPQLPGLGRAKLEKILRQYRMDLAAGLETYRVVGTLYDVEELRQRMRTTSKPLTDYFVVATHYGRFLQKYAGLQPNSHIIDIGCSWGYLAFALANFLNKEGAYLGVEIQGEATKWAKERLGWLGENFKFVHLDIHNDFYNPAGDLRRNQARLPVPDGWANVIIAGSVFTHMLEDGVQAYLDEICRVLVPNGVAAFSYDDSTYWSSDEAYAIGDKNIPDKTTFYSRSKIKDMVLKAGLKPAREPVNMRQFDRTDYQTWYFATKS
jgi:ubiquinone/menaquinone biosynthesis C-methylase UbiE